MLKKIFFPVLIAGALFIISPASASDEKDHARSELLLTVSPPRRDADRDAYLNDIASSAEAKVVKVYAALSGESDPILLLIHSPTRSVEDMAELLSRDERVLAATPNYVRRLTRAPLTGL